MFFKRSLTASGTADFSSCVLEGPDYRTFPPESVT